MAQKQCNCARDERKLVSDKEDKDKDTFEASFTSCRALSCLLSAVVVVVGAMQITPQKTDPSPPGLQVPGT